MTNGPESFSRAILIHQLFVYLLNLDAMKNLFPLIALIVISNVELLAQHPLVGTWEMVSLKGVDAVGEKFYKDTSTIREIKIITPTHYMLIAEDVVHDSLVFNRCYGGKIKIEGQRYIELPTVSSSPIFDNVTTDYTWKIEGDKFIQSGTLTRPDGKKIVLEAMVFRRAKISRSYNKNPGLGSWDMISSSYTHANGTKESYTNATATCLQLITPTHWMYISRRNDKFESAMGGVYSIKGDKFYPSLDHASFPKQLLGKLEATQKVEGDKLTINGTSTYPDGGKLIWEDVFKKAGP
jgi:hypothetical protein